VEVEYPFTLLDKKIQFWIGKLGISKPTEIQRLAIKPILDGYCVLLISPTGSGKTEAAIFPLIHKILSENGEGVKILYVNPLKALTRDLTQRVGTYAHFLGLKVRPLYGDVSKAFKKPVPDIVIITPESLEVVLDWSPRWWQFFKNIKYVVIDEVHELISSKRGYHLLVLLERLKQLTGKSLQRVCLSATIANPSIAAEIFGSSDGKLKVLRAIAERDHLFEPIISIPLTQEEIENPFIAGARVVSELINDKKSLIFVNSRYTAERLESDLEKKGIPVAVHHGSIGLEERESSEDAFKKGEIKAVIATKTLELGIDIGDVQQVIQYRSPGQVNVLIQRAGRSFHKPGQKSVCKIVSTDPEDFIECLALINLFNKKFLEEPVIFENPLDIAAKEVLGYSLYNYKGERHFKGNFSPADFETIYKTLKNCPFFKSLTTTEFKQLVINLLNNGLISGDNIPYPGSRFWNVWRFEESEKLEWPSLQFNEFFTMIPKRETFVVWVEQGFGRRRKLGELDSSFVYRSLATGMVIRFAGGNWKVGEIDENRHDIFVTEVKEGGEVPTWKGEGPQRNKNVAKEMLTLLNSFIKEPEKITDFVKDEKAAKAVLDYLHNLESSYLEHLNSGGVIVESIPPLKTWIFITFFGEKINRTLSSAIYEKIAEKSLLVKYVVSPIGFAFKSEVINPLQALKSIKTEEFQGLVEKHVKESSPFTKLVKDQIKEHFGFPRDETLIDKEAARQTLGFYYALDEAPSIFKKIKMGHFIEITRAEPSQLGDSILKYPFERAWLGSLKPILKEALDKLHHGTLDDLFEYTWCNPAKAKEELKELSREKDIVAFLDPTLKGWSTAKIPLEEEWISIKVPISTRFFNIKNEGDIHKVKEELTKEPFQLSKLLGEEIEFTFTGIEERMKKPYNLKVNKVFEIMLDNIINTRVKGTHKKVDIKIHIKGTRITLIHYGVPVELLKPIIQHGINTSRILLEKGIVTGKRQIVFELP